MKSFAPTADTVNVAVSAASQTVNLGRPDQVRVMNNGSATVWCRLGASGITVSASNGFPVAPGATEVISVPAKFASADVFAAVIAGGATGSIYFTPGTGI